MSEHLTDIQLVTLAILRNNWYPARQAADDVGEILGRGVRKNMYDVLSTLMHQKLVTSDKRVRSLYRSNRRKIIHYTVTERGEGVLERELQHWQLLLNRLRQRAMLPTESENGP